MEHYFSRIKQYCWILFVCTLLALVTGFLVAKSRPPVFQAASILLVESGPNGTNFIQITTIDPQQSLVQANTYAAEIRTRSVMEFVYNSDPEINRHGYTVDALLSSISATPSPTSATISISAVTLHPEDTVLLANDVATGFVAYTQRHFQQELDTQRNDLQNQLDNYQKQKKDLEGKILALKSTSDPAYNIYTNDLDIVNRAIDTLQQQLLLLPSAAHSDVSVSQLTTIADVVASGKSTLIIGAAGAVGLFVGVLIMLLVIFLDNRLLSDEQVKEKLGLAYLGHLPNDREIKGEPARATDVALNELSDICANLHFTGVLPREHHNPHGDVLLITSAQIAEGKTTLALALASTFARRGARVVVLDGNLRQPSTHLAFGIKVVGPGLSGLLQAQNNGLVDHVVQRSKLPNVWLLAGGTAISDPAFLLEHELPRVLAQLRQKTDLIIIDGPALLSRVDASILAMMVDGIVLVVDVRHNKLRLLLRAKELLNSLVRAPIGVVMNRGPRGGRNQYYATAYQGNTTIEKEMPVQVQGVNGNGYKIGSVITTPDRLPITPPAIPSTPRQFLSLPFRQQGMSVPKQEHTGQDR